MNKAEFMALLKSELDKYKVKNVVDVLADYEEHFQVGLSKGKSESDIAAALGSPLAIAKAYETENMIQEIRQTSSNFQWGLALNVLGRLLIIAPFNFIIFFIPGIIVFSLVMSGWAIAASIIAAAFWILPAVPEALSMTTSLWVPIGGFSACLGLLCFGLFCLMIMFVTSKHIVLGLINYLQWNLKFVLQNAEK